MEDVERACPVLLRAPAARALTSSTSTTTAGTGPPGRTTSTSTASTFTASSAMAAPEPSSKRRRAARAQRRRTATPTTSAARTRTRRMASSRVHLPEQRHRFRLSMHDIGRTNYGQGDHGVHLNQGNNVVITGNYFDTFNTGWASSSTRTPRSERSSRTTRLSARGPLPNTHTSSRRQPDRRHLHQQHLLERQRAATHVRLPRPIYRYHVQQQHHNRLDMCDASACTTKGSLSATASPAPARSSTRHPKASTTTVTTATAARGSSTHSTAAPTPDRPTGNRVLKVGTPDESRPSARSYSRLSRAAPRIHREGGKPIPMAQALGLASVGTWAKLDAFSTMASASVFTVFRPWRWS